MEVPKSYINNPEQQLVGEVIQEAVVTNVLPTRIRFRLGSGKIFAFIATNISPAGQELVEFEGKRVEAVRVKETVMEIDLSHEICIEISLTQPPFPFNCTASLDVPNEFQVLWGQELV